MPKYWGKQIFTHGSFPEVGQKQKTERKRKKKDWMMVRTMASYALQRHLGWRTRSCLGQWFFNWFISLFENRMGQFLFSYFLWPCQLEYSGFFCCLVFRFITEVSLDAGPFHPWKACVRGAVRDKLLKSSVWPCDSPVHCPSLEFWLPSVDNLVIWIYLTFPGKAWRHVKPFSAHLSIL